MVSADQTTRQALEAKKVARLIELARRLDGTCSWPVESEIRDEYGEVAWAFDPSEAEYLALATPKRVAALAAPAPADTLTEALRDAPNPFEPPPAYTIWYTGKRAAALASDVAALAASAPADTRDGTIDEWVDLAEQTLDGTLPYEETWRSNAEAVIALASLREPAGKDGEDDA